MYMYVEKLSKNFILTVCHFVYRPTKYEQVIQVFSHGIKKTSNLEKVVWAILQNYETATCEIYL